MKSITPVPATRPKAFRDTNSPGFTPILADTDIPADNAALIAAITRLAGHINAAQHRFLKLLAALIEREAWGDGGGIKSPAHWLNYYCGIDLGAAREKVRVAKCLTQLPQIDEAFASGAISYSKVRAMTRSATPHNEAHLLNIARHGTAHHVEMLVRKHQRVKRQVRGLGQGNEQDQRGNRDGDAAAAQFAGRGLHWHYDDDGMLVIRGRLTPEDGALFIKAIDGAFAQLHQSSANSETQVAPVRKIGSQNVSTETFYPNQNTDSQKDVSAETFYSNHNPECSKDASEETFSPYQDPKSQTHISAQRFSASQNPESDKNVSAETFLDSQETKADTFPQKRADALMLLIEHSLQHSTGDLAPLTPPHRHQMIIHIEKNTLMRGAAHHCSIEHGPFLSPASARRLACDTSLLTVLEDSQGNVLNVGRKTRTVSPALRRALTIRDHCCRFPGCTESRFVDAHHIHHWCDGGETSLENLVLLCRRHHRLVHDQGYELINRGAGHIEFRRPDRQILPEALYPQFVEHEAHEEHLAIERLHQRMGLHVDDYTAITRWQGERMDYSMAMEGILGSAA